MTRVWFNHWFSTAYHIINLIKDENDVYVIGSNRRPESVIKLVCDEWYTEPDVMSDEDYLEYCVDFCREHKIDVFAPRRGMAAISRNAERFSEINTKLLLDTETAAVEIFRNKAETYRYIKDIAPECIPLYYEVSDLEQFKDAYADISGKYERACFKFTADEGAVSFRVIDNTMDGGDGLYKAPGMKISIDTAVNILSSYNFKNHLLVMPYLKGEEVSCDCLDTPKGKIIIPRFKQGSRLYTIKYDETLMGLCSRIMDRSRLEMPCNIQFKYDGEKPYLLEINTRMSGGVQLSCMSAGVNIPDIAFNKLMGADRDWRLNDVPDPVSYIEMPVKV